MAHKKIQRSNMTQTDAAGKVVRAPKEDKAEETGNFEWWKRREGEDDTTLAMNIASTIRFISRHQSPRIEQLTVSTRLYGQSTAYNLLGAAFTRASSINSNPQSQRISFNLCSSVVDTLVSKIAKDKVLPTFLTSGGDWKMQRKAEKLSKFLEGCFYAHKVHEKGVYAFRDSAVWDGGILHICEYNDDIYVERVLPHELYVDIVESFVSQEPRQLHWAKITNRSVVQDMYPDKAEEIAECIPATYDDIGGQATTADLITVTESWHLPSGPDADDGMHVICCGDVVLYQEEWEKDYFPFAFMFYNKKQLGFWGQGCVERLQNIQGEINRNLILVQRSLWMGGSFKVLIENGSKVVSQHLNNDVGAIIHYTGTPPQYITPPMVQADIYQWIDSLIDKGYRQEGISTMSAQSEKPAGIDSGKALRTLTDIESDRFLFLQQCVEQFFLEVGRQIIEVAKGIYEKKGEFKVMFPSTNFVETIDWKDIDLEADEYILKAYPTSSLPNEPAGRFQTIQEYMQAGLISPRAGRRLMYMPDLEMSDVLANAKEDLLHQVFEDMLDHKKWRTPEPFWDLQQAKSLCMDYYNYADFHNAPDDVLALLRRFSASLDDMMGVNIPPPPPSPVPGAPGANQPMANPITTPTSPMISNVNTPQQ